MRPTQPSRSGPPAVRRPSHRRRATAERPRRKRSRQRRKGAPRRWEEGAQRPSRAVTDRGPTGPHSRVSSCQNASPPLWHGCHVLPPRTPPDDGADPTRSRRRRSTGYPPAPQCSKRVSAWLHNPGERLRGETAARAAAASANGPGTVTVTVARCAHGHGPNRC
jgi:hypothetical protein